MVDYGKKIKELRKKNKDTQAQLGNKLGYDNRTISDYECNKCTPSHETLVKIANIYNVPLDYFDKEDSQVEEKKLLENDKYIKSYKKFDMKFLYLTLSFFSLFHVVTFITLFFKTNQPSFFIAILFFITLVTQLATLIIYLFSPKYKEVISSSDNTPLSFEYNISKKEKIGYISSDILCLFTEIIIMIFLYVYTEALLTSFLILIEIVLLAFKWLLVVSNIKKTSSNDGEGIFICHIMEIFIKLILIISIYWILYSRELSLLKCIINIFTFLEIIIWLINSIIFCQLITKTKKK